MTKALKNRVAGTTTSVGTGALTCDAATVDGFANMSVLGEIGDTFTYAITLAAQWEVGLATITGVSPLVFTREAETGSGGDGVEVDFAAGIKVILHSVSAADLAAFLTATSGAVLFTSRENNLSDVANAATALSNLGGTTAAAALAAAQAAITLAALGGVNETGVATLTNKRVTRRVATPGSSATPLSAINTDSYDEVNILGLAVAITAMTFGSGTPVTGDQITIHITDNGTARAITWGTTSTEDSANVVRPLATLGGGQKLSLYFDYNAATSKWRLVGLA